MIIQAELKRKQSEYEGEACSVDKVIELPAQRFQQFSRALLADYDFIAENKTAIRHDDDSRHCLLILDAEGKDSFLVDPQGYNYARYSAFVPNARTVNGKDVTMTDGNAIVPLTVVNNPGFDLPKTGGYGTWMFTIGGVALLGAAAFIVVKSRKHKSEQ